MSEFQKWGIRSENNNDKSDKNQQQLKFKCDKCGEIINISNRPEKNSNSNGGYAGMLCTRCHANER